MLIDFKTTDRHFKIQLTHKVSVLEDKSTTGKTTFVRYVRAFLKRDIPLFCFNDGKHYSITMQFASMLPKYCMRDDPPDGALEWCRQQCPGVPDNQLWKKCKEAYYKQGIPFK